MSRHHRAQKWSTHAPKLRARIVLPAPCLDCPHPVMPDQKWQVGHRKAASAGGAPTVANSGPSHTYCPTCQRRCNQSSGGRMGAVVTNQARRRTRDRSNDIREW
jgi:hypothetical protein